MEKIEEHYKFWFCNFWGASETGPGTISFPDSPREKRLFTVGRPHEGESAKVIHPETGVELPKERWGESVKGWNVITAYWNNPDETSRHVDREGWFHLAIWPRWTKMAMSLLWDVSKTRLIAGG